MKNIVKIIAIFFIFTLLISTTYGSATDSGNMGDGTRGNSSGNTGGGGGNSGGGNGGSSDDFGSDKDNTPPRDTTRPTGSIISYSPTGWTTGSVRITSSCSDASGCTQSQYTRTVNNNGVGAITISDTKGNTSSIGFNVWNIDKIKPSEGTIVYNPPGWTRGSVKVTIPCSDGASGCAASNYSITHWSNTNGSLSLRDNVGNSKSVAYSVTNIDTTPPTPSVGYSDTTWTNQDVTVYINCFDAQSGCNMNSFDGWTGAGSIFSKTFPSNTSGSVVLRDTVSNFSSNTNYSIANIDKTLPTIADITGGSMVDNHNQYIYAHSGKLLSLNIGVNGGSPIESVEGTINNRPTRFNKIGSIWYTIVDISDVDRLKNTNNYSEYNLEITKIKDEAGNEMIVLPTYTYNVYADVLSAGNTTIVSTDLTESKILDGAVDEMLISIEDQYGNDIVPVKEANGTIVRNVVFDINYLNSLYLNQYTQSGLSAVYRENDIELSILDSSYVITKDDINQTKDYTFDFVVYAPTNTGDGGFTIDSIGIATTESGGIPFTDYNNIIFNYEAPYTTSFSGELVYDGFTEGGSQKSIINFTGSCPTCGEVDLSLEFGLGAAKQTVTAGDLTLVSGGTVANVLIGEGSFNKTIIKQNITNVLIDYDIETLLQLEPLYTVNELENTYLSSHIGYTLGGNDVIYNSEIINPSISVVGLKVYGNTHSQQQYNIVDNQEVNDLQILGNLDKAILKSNIQSNVFRYIRNLPPTSGSEITSLNGGGDVLYFSRENGENIILDMGSEKLIGKKTIIVKGGNLYIKSNVLYNSKTDILGIIVLKNTEGKGGNIYVDPSVTQINGTIFADKSIISYDGVKELDGNTLQSVLKNQLYIYGSLFTVNTIGGSRIFPPKCPYYITGNCSLEMAQKYDLNYLRRYYLHSGIPANSGIPVFQSTQDNYKYPVVIEYNPLLQISPPPLFKN